MNTDNRIPTTQKAFTSSQQYHPDRMTEATGIPHTAQDGNPLMHPSIQPILQIQGSVFGTDRTRDGGY